jgi:hypothetical protein
MFENSISELPENEILGPGLAITNAVESRPNSKARTPEESVQLLYGEYFILFCHFGSTLIVTSDVVIS